MPKISPDLKKGGPQIDIYKHYILIHIGAKRAGKVGVQNENSDLFSKIRALFNKIRDLFSTTRLRDQKNNGCTCTRCTR